MLYDSNSDKPDSPDLFTRSLRENFERELKDFIRFPSQSFEGSLDADGVWKNLFSGKTANICASGADVVLAPTDVPPE